LVGRAMRMRFPYGLRVTVEATVHPSEDPKKVFRAIASIFGDSGRVGSSKGSMQVVYDGPSCLEKVYEDVRTKRTVSALRRLLRRSVRGSTASFLLNKQAATRGSVVLCEEEAESPLGPLRVKLETAAIEELIEWLAPQVSPPERKLRQRQLH